MSDFLFSLITLSIILAPPMLYSLIYFFTERKGISSKKIYLRFIVLFIIFYFLYFGFWFLVIYTIDFINFILKKYFIYSINDLSITNFIIFSILILTLYTILYIKIMKKYFSFNDINLFFILKTILTVIIMIVNPIDLIGEGQGYYIMFYSAFFTPLCWILFLINSVVQFNKSKRKEKEESDINPSETNEREKEQ